MPLIDSPAEIEQRRANHTDLVAATMHPMWPDAAVREWLMSLPYKVVEEDPETQVKITKWPTCRTDAERIEVIEDMLNSAWTDEMSHADADVVLRALNMMGHVYKPPTVTKYDKAGEIKSRESLVSRQIELRGVSS